MTEWLTQYNLSNDYNDYGFFLSQLTIIMVHCIDPNQVKTTGLQEVFPAYFR